MANIDILNNKPFKDANLTNTINRIDNETSVITSIPYATFSNPSTTERTLLLTENQVASQKLFSTVAGHVNLTSNITGIQTFTFKLYLGATVVAQSVVTVPDALNTLFAVKLDGFITYSRINGVDIEYLANLTATPVATSATASVSTITVVNTASDLVTYATLAGNFNTKLTCTASAGTTTTVITAIGGRATFDNRN